MFGVSEAAARAIRASSNSCGCSGPSPMPPRQRYGIELSGLCEREPCGPAARWSAACCCSPCRRFLVGRAAVVSRRPVPMPVQADFETPRLGVVLLMGALVLLRALSVSSNASAPAPGSCRTPARFSCGVLSLLDVLYGRAVPHRSMCGGEVTRFRLLGASARRLSGAAGDGGWRVPGVPDAVRRRRAAAAADGVPGLRRGCSGLFGSRDSGAAGPGPVQRGADRESEAMNSRRLRGRRSPGSAYRLSSSAVGAVPGRNVIVIVLPGGVAPASAARWRCARYSIVRLAASSEGRSRRQA